MRRAVLFWSVPIVFLALGLSAVYSKTDEQQFVLERRQMVQEQIQARGVKDPRVLKAMEKVLRHRFVPESLQEMAYRDGPLPIGEGQTISQPYIVALMTELAEIKEGEKVLEVGTGSGYQAVVLAELTPKVCTIEILPILAERAKVVLDSLGYSQVKIRVGDGYLGWPEEAPFDAILVTAAPDHVPKPLIDQLVDGGVLVIPVGPEGAIQQLKRIRKEEGQTVTETIVPVSFVPLIHKSDGV